MYQRPDRLVESSRRGPIGEAELIEHSRELAG